MHKNLLSNLQKGLNYCNRFHARNFTTRHAITDNTRERI